MSLRIKTIKNNPVTSNCYIVSCSMGNSCVIIDPGSRDCVSLLIYLEREHLLPEYVILTHEHFDHIGGVDALRKHFNIQLIASRGCSEAIGIPKRNMSVFYDGRGWRIGKADIITEEVRSLKWEKYHLDFIESPGHTLNGISISIEDVLFTGDTMIHNLKTVTKLPGGDKKQLRKTLTHLFSQFSPCVKVLPGHGEAFFFKDVEVENFI